MKFSDLGKIATALLATTMLATTIGCSPADDTNTTPSAPTPTAPPPDDKPITAPTPPSTPPPAPEPESAASNFSPKTTFAVTCGTCHGPTGDGFSGAIPGFSENATDNRLEKKCDEELIASLIKGVPGTAMSPYGTRTDMTEDNARTMIKWIRKEIGNNTPEPKCKSR